MSTLTRYSPLAIQSSRVHNELAKTTDMLNYEQAVAQLQLGALSRQHGAASFEVARTMATAELIRAGRMRAMTPQEETAYRQLDNTYLRRVYELMNMYSEKIVRVGMADHY